MQFTDEWLVPSIETLLSEEAIKALRQESGPDASLWEILVQRALAVFPQLRRGSAAPASAPRETADLPI